jgi:hypothetical protein
MSVQLIVFPQSHNGQYNSIVTSANDFIVDGINFNTINTSSSYDSTALNSILSTLTNAPPTQVNTWFRFRSTVFGTPTIPTELSGNLTLLSVPVSTQAGVYQKLSNLVVGTVYEMTLTLSTTGLGDVLTAAYNGTTQISSIAQSASLSLITFSWTASSAEDTIIISYNNTTTDFIAISNISVSQQGITPNIDLQDGQVICDLYEDEDIPLSLSVDDFKNVAENVQSYSKAFNLPATKRNNQIFDNIFEVTRTDTGLNFNPYKKTKAILKQDGFLLFEGYLRMIDISDKSGEISYNVNLYSEVVALADVLGDRTFSELDFTELQHDYNKTNIKLSWNDTGSSITYSNPDTSGYRDNYTTLRYPFVDWTHQILIGGSSGTGTNATVGNPEYTALEQIFRPFINIKYLIDRIFQAVPFTFESDFFNTDDFKKLYMDFNWGADNNPITGAGTNSGGTGKLTNLTTSFTNMGLKNLGGLTLPVGWSSTLNKLTSSLANEGYVINYTLSYSGVSGDTIDRQWVHKDSSGNTLNVFNASTITLPSGVTTYSYVGSFSVLLQPTETLQLEAKTTDTTSSSFQFAGSGSVTFSGYFVSITSNLILQTLRGELGQWDFLKGLMTMFNLVTLPDEDNPSNIKIEPYGDIFMSSGDATNPNFFDDTSSELDWTEKIDVSEMKLMPLTDLNKKTIFKFVEDEDDYVFNVYKNANNHLYGSKKYDASEFTILAGEDEVVAEPFAATIVKPLEPIYPDFITPAIYSMNEDETSEGFENSPRIMFNNGLKSTGASYYIPAQNGGTSANEPDFLQFSHLTSLPPGAIATDRRDFHFGECQLIPPVGAPTNNNLFNLYWLPYYSELYNPDTRIMTIKVNLSPSDINTFKFNDTVFIKNRTFRVNKIDYKPNDLATVEFILIP